MDAMGFDSISPTKKLVKKQHSGFPIISLTDAIGYLGGGNSNIFYFHPDPRGNDPIWLSHIFQGGWFNH